MSQRSTIQEAVCKRGVDEIELTIAKKPKPAFCRGFFS
ncbi:hypothetical protein XAC2852_380102 [Xanthomonas citri pv. citri]|nr:hypothetical protein XAC2852_380102 [Xanthomonas citri pv. citri]CEJ43613.1 hypothetical protein XAB3213_2100014 [Xanthomonas citri pv. bilvae]CEF24515.1 hypothetical protein XACJK2_690031 [Xanthomonas citri pv. citri]CEF45138.1 hypothetical protein XAC217_400094 [Xanthomonas citri pv. citri]CEH73383.1 hypothetical protein XACS582_5890010 [Xanthomonas citri pv. citri]